MRSTSGYSYVITLVPGPLGLEIKHLDEAPTLLHFLRAGSGQQGNADKGADVEEHGPEKGMAEIIQAG